MPTSNKEGKPGQKSCLLALQTEMEGYTYKPRIKMACQPHVRGSFA